MPGSSSRSRRGVRRIPVCGRYLEGPL